MTAVRFSFFVVVVVAGFGLRAAFAVSNDESPLGKQQPQGKLLLSSGDYYAGRLADADRGDAIAWQTDVAAGPFLFPLQKLKSVDFPSNDNAAPPKGLFCFELSDGQAFYGDLIAASADGLVVNAERFGRLNLEREDVSRLYRHDGSRGDLADGLQGLAGWTIEGIPADWREEAGGLVTEVQGASLSREVSLPAKFCLELDAEWVPDTGVKFDFGDVFRIESWEDHVLLVREPGPKPLLPAADTEPAEWSYAFDEPAEGWQRPDFDDSKWKKGQGGFGSPFEPNARTVWETPDIWIRRTFDMPKTSARPQLYMRHDEDADVYINGVSAAKLPSFNGSYDNEQISDEAIAALKPTGNVIAIHCHQTGGGQYIDAGLVAGGGGDGDFASIKCEQPNKIRVRCFVDAQAGKVAAVDFDGNILSTVQLAPGGDIAVDLEKALFRLVSYSSQLRIKQLVVSPWDGAEPTKQDQEGIRLRLASGERVGADSIELQEGGDQIATTRGGQTESYPIEQAASVIFGPRRFESTHPYWINLKDGSVLCGELAKVDAGSLLIKTSLADRELAIPLGDLRSINNIDAKVVSTAPASSTTADKEAEKAKEPTRKVDEPWTPLLEAEGIASHGSLEPIESSPNALALAWRPADSLSAAPLLRSAQLRVQLLSNKPKAADGGLSDSGAVPGEDPRITLWRMQNMLDQQQKPVAKRTSVPGLQGAEEYVVLTSGDRIPCRVTKFDDTGLYVTSEVTSETFIPANRIRIWESNRETWLEAMSEKKRQRLLTLPRKQRDAPPTHILESVTSDLMRTRLMRGDEENVYAMVGLKEQPIARANIQRIVWIPQDDRPKKGQNSPKSAEAPQPASEATKTGLVQALLDDTLQVTMSEPRLADGKLVGESDQLGQCTVGLDAIAEIRFGGLDQGESAKLVNAKWKLRDAIDPIYMQDEVLEAEGRMTAGLTFPLVGKPAPSFSAPTLAGAPVQLRSLRGRVVVLDFWASWCGPCIQAFPEIVSVANSYDESKVQLVSVNINDDKESIAACLDRLDLSPMVAMDTDGTMAKQYLVKSIPQTVVIDPDGKIARVFVGSSPQLSKQLRFAIDELLAGN